MVPSGVTAPAAAANRSVLCMSSTGKPVWSNCFLTSCAPWYTAAVRKRDASSSIFTGLRATVLGSFYTRSGETAMHWKCIRATSIPRASTLKRRAI